VSVHVSQKFSSHLLKLYASLGLFRVTSMVKV
jgi:hypothetical protein